jgi:hypothetical protein
MGRAISRVPRMHWALWRTLLSAGLPELPAEPDPVRAALPQGLARPESGLWRDRAGELAEALRQVIAEGPDTRRMLNDQGVDVLPSSFYSPVPSVREIEASFEYGGAEAPFDDCALFEGVEMREFLERLLPFASEFVPPRDAPADGRSFYWQNAFFSHADAMAYYCIVRLLRPRRIVEIGSGYSTLVASAALEKNGSGELVCVEPHPPEFLREQPRLAHIEKALVQELPLSFFRESLGDGDILFIDSTHTVKAGSDCVYLYLKALPAIEARVFVHTHDIFLPESMPQHWLLRMNLYWNEQYLVQALLTGNSRYRVRFGSRYHARHNLDLLDRLMTGKAASDGGSLWFERL